MSVKRAKPLSPPSAKRQAANVVRRELTRRKFEQSRGRCVLQVERVCAGRAHALHELKSRGRGGSIVEWDNTVPACNPCNGWVADNPTDARERKPLAFAFASYETVPPGHADALVRNALGHATPRRKSDKEAFVW